ncbi:MAG: hypothetical protein H6876_08730 [Hyphomicrobiaceae bacterium]|nr:hypothetical protein [Hyphomicrobiaceae bacterium]
MTYSTAVAPTISIAKTTDGSESGPTNAVFTVTVTPINTSGVPITGNIAYGGTATNGTDYGLGATTFSIPNNSSTATITLNVVDDGLVEGTETVTATISSPSTGTIGTASATADITDNDNYSVSIAKTTDGSESGPANAVFTVTVTPTNLSGAPITGNIAYGGTATNGTDYGLGATTFSIPNNSSTATITLNVVDDGLVEGTETVTATISSPSTGTIGTASATAGITDNDNYSVSIAKTTDGSESGPTNAVFTVTVTPTNLSGAPITGNIAYGGTATNGTDYGLGATTFSIPNNSSTATITLNVVDDGLVEGTETVTATISSPSTGTIGTASATADITDNDNYSVSIAKTTDGSESGPANAVFTVTVTPTNLSGAPITGNIAYGGTATNGTDYGLGATTFSIPNNSSTATITLNVVDDGLVEGTETVTATISSPSTGTIGTASATAGITDNDNYSVSIAKTTDGSESGPANAVFTVTVTPTNLSGAPITGNIAYGGTATNGTDYGLGATTFSIPNNSSTATITLNVVDDGLVEGTETVTATISSPSTGTIGTASATADITDNDNYSVSIAKTTDGSESGPTNAVFTVTVTPTNLSGAPITGNIAYGGTATNGTDYGLGATTFSIPNNSSTATITLNVVDDGLVEGTETVTATISSPSTGTIGTASATADITDNDNYSVSIAKTTDGSESGPTNAVFTVTVTPTNLSGAPITGNIAYGGTATNGTDYGLGATTFSIPNNSSTATITLNVVDDGLVEGTETVTATISSPSTGTIGTASATADITDNDNYSVSIAKTTDGSESGPTNAVFTVTVTPTNLSGAPITGNIAYGGTATNGTDYGLGATTFSIPNNSSTATITLNVVDDGLVEGTETVTATISSPSTGTIGTASATAGITDNDNYSVSIAKTTDGSESGPTDVVFTVTVTPTNLSGAPITGNIAYGGTATNGTDYGLGPTTFSIPNNSSTATITLSVLTDEVVEGTETVTATISSPSTGLIGTASATANIADDVSFVQTRTSRIIANFMSRRADQITASDPDLVSRMVGCGSGGSPATVGGDGRGDSERFNFATSLRQLSATKKKEGETKERSAESDSRLRQPCKGFDIWASGQWSRNRTDDTANELGLFYLGVDYHLSPSLVVGLLAQFDHSKETDNVEGFAVRGNGWLVGPYVVARLTDTLIFDGRAAWGQSNNKVDPLGLYEDDFETERWLARARLTGDYRFGNFMLQPHVGVIYFHETQKAYTDSLNLAIPSQTISLGRLTFGPKFGYMIQGSDGTVIIPKVGITGIWDFDKAEVVDLATGLPTGSSAEIRARVEAGISISLPSGMSLQGEGFYDGIGASDVEAYGGSVKLNLPLN